MKILKLALVILTVFISYGHSIGQKSTTPDIPAQIKEYSVVFVRAYYQGNNVVYDEVGLSKSPVIAMPNGQSGIIYDMKKMFSENPKGKLKDINMVINYCASFGWTLVSSNTMPYNADKRNEGSILDGSQYSQVLIFERPYQQPSEQKQN